MINCGGGKFDIFRLILVIACSYVSPPSSGNVEARKIRHLSIRSCASAIQHLKISVSIFLTLKKSYVSQTKYDNDHSKIKMDYKIVLQSIL